MPGNDKRAHQRKKVLIPACAYDLERSQSFKCVVRDASRGGCLIISSEVQDLPDQILLEVVNFKGTRQGEIVWRDTKTAGVKFV